MQKQITTEIELSFSPEQVWQVLVKLEEYHNWNPFIIRSKGKVIAGQQVENTMLNGPQEISFKPQILNVEVNRYFDWIGHLWIKGIFDGHHYFKLEPMAKGTRLIHGENFKGILSGLILKKIGVQTRQNFIRMNEALEAELKRQFKS